MTNVIDASVKFTEQKVGFQIMKEVYESTIGTLKTHIDAHPIDILHGVCTGLNTALEQYTDVLSENDKEKFIGVFKQYVNEHSFRGIQ